MDEHHDVAVPLLPPLQELEEEYRNDYRLRLLRAIIDENPVQIIENIELNRYQVLDGLFRTMRGNVTVWNYIENSDSDVVVNAVMTALETVYSNGNITQHGNGGFIGTAPALHNKKMLSADTKAHVERVLDRARHFQRGRNGNRNMFNEPLEFFRPRRRGESHEVIGLAIILIFFGGITFLVFTPVMETTNPETKETSNTWSGNRFLFSLWNLAWMSVFTISVAQYIDRYIEFWEYNTHNNPSVTWFVVTVAVLVPYFIFVFVPLRADIE